MCKKNLLTSILYGFDVTYQNSQPLHVCALPRWVIVVPGSTDLHGEFASYTTYIIDRGSKA